MNAHDSVKQDDGAFGALLSLPKATRHSQRARSAAKPRCWGRELCVAVHARHRQSFNHGTNQLERLRAASSGTDETLRKR